MYLLYHFTFFRRGSDELPPALLCKSLRGRTPARSDASANATCRCLQGVPPRCFLRGFCSLSLRLIKYVQMDGHTESLLELEEALAEDVAGTPAHDGAVSTSH